MSSTEPPSRIPPRGQAQDSKAAREELSSKGKVEKVREVDPDEEARKKKFLQYYKGVDEEDAKDERPSLFDISSRTNASNTTGKTLGSKPPSFDDAAEDAVPSPAYTPPPDVRGNNTATNAPDPSAQEGALPQSDHFWQDYDFHDQPVPPANLQEQQGLIKSTEEGRPRESSLTEHKARTEEIKKKKEAVNRTKEKVIERKEDHQDREDKKSELSPFGPPGKAVAKEGHPTVGFSQKKGELPEKEKKKLPSPFDEVPHKALAPRQSGEKNPLGKVKEKTASRERDDEVNSPPQEIGIGAIKSDAGDGGEERRDRREEKVHEIEAPSLPRLPAGIEPMAMSATTQASSYLTPTNASLFYQMVGTIYVMSGPSGVNRTEILLNNPTFANSKFYGSTITIEKYATAPDSFNIRLTGSQEAVVSFKENIPSLLSAFENGKFAFRVGRIDVEYSLEKPVFRRREKGEDRGDDTGGGEDLGERRNK